MTRFTDDAGRAWDVVLGRESWGTLVALFVPVDGGAPRQAVLPAASHDEAQRALDGMDVAGLRELLRTSTEKGE